MAKKIPLAYKAALFNSNYTGQGKDETYTTSFDHEILQKLHTELKKTLTVALTVRYFFVLEF